MPVSYDVGECQCISMDDPPVRLIHENIRDCAAAIKKLRVQRSGYQFADDPKGQAALLWLQTQASEVDCTRFLLKAKGVLWDKAEDRYPSESIYWETCASLFIELLARQTRTRVEIQSKKILDTIIHRFENARGEPWAARAHLIRFLGDFGTSCLSRIATPTSGSEYCIFWNAIDLFMRYLEAAYDCVGHPPFPTNLTLSLSYLVDSWFRVVTSLTAEKKDIPDDVQREITHCAGPLFGMIWETDPLSDDLTRWQEAIVALLENIPFTDRSANTNTCFGDLAGLLTDSRNKASPEIQGQRAPLFRTLIPPLHGRQYSCERKVMRPPDNACDVEFSDEANQLRVPGSGHIKDVCPSSCLGFYLETEAIIIDRNYEQGDGIIGALDPPYLYSYRSIEARTARTATAMKIDWVTLTISYQVGGKKHKEKFPCRIMRAWLQENGVGLALRVPLKAIGGRIPPAWKRYVAQLPDAHSR